MQVNTKKGQTMKKLTPNKEHIKEHINFLFGECREYSDGKIEIAFTSNNSGAVNRAEYFDATQISEAIEFAYNKNANEGVNVYIGAALRAPNTAPFGRSSAADYYASTVLWCDLDDAEAAKTAKNKYTKLPPSMVVVTGRHPNTRAQVWWKTMHPEQDGELLKENLGHVCAALDGDTAVVDHARVMRIAGTIAWPKKEGRIPEITDLIVPEKNTKMVLIDQFKDFFDVSPEQLQKTNPANSSCKNLFTGTFEIEKLLEISKEEGKWHTSMRDAIASMIGKGWTDEQIRIATNPYRRDNSLTEDMISPLIYSARNKYDRPEPKAKKELTFQTKEKFDPETGEVKESKTTLYYERASNVTPSFDVNDFVQDTLTEGSMSVIYGESNCGKTFFSSDLAFHIVEGKEWRNKRVEQGGALYVSMEGAHGLNNRIAAYKKETGAKLNDLLVMPCTVDFIDPEGNINEFAEILNNVIEDVGDLKIIFIDTLARAVGGGDENSGQDMGMLVRHADAIRALTKAHICFIHHSGKDKARGARGHSSLRAAVDTEIEISREEGDDFSNVKFAKQRDMEMEDDIQFSLKRVVLGENRHGDEVTSCIVQPVIKKTKEKGARLTSTQLFIYNNLVRAVTDYGQYKQVNGTTLKVVSYDELREVMEENGFKEFMETKNKTTAQQVKSTTQAARLALQRHNKVSFNGRYIWLMNEED